ncbi:TetR/AcrR family transcriptional regulator [Lactiplantibacillus daowaiensis]|uniref:TetR/AcrR family transcriptional regulator n=1 Tax=Lactiplantibacillus daowaiensis TaxID=2559918 RepID=A0ABW1S4K6_9LACO|nr:TetR/AcrR family transcriptional regulator [Lactiplantibacillus daowaiensis]
MTQPKIRDYFQQTVAADPDLTPKQQAILQASLDLFAEQGFDHTSTSDIAQRAGVAEGTVYRRYKTKNAIREAVVAPIIDHIVPSLAADFTREELETKYTDLASFFRSVFANRLEFVNDNIKELKVALEMVFFTPGSREAMIQHVGPIVVDNIMGIFDDFKARHLMVDWPNDLIVQTMLSMLLGYFARVVMAIPPIDTQRELDYFVAMLTQAFTPKPENQV